jgi:UDP-N-acetylmuramoyl-tripeptide--D-alanyl-D-alanine ligase
MLESNSFFIEHKSSFPIYVVGKAGKTMFQKVLTTLFPDSLAVAEPTTIHSLNDFNLATDSVAGETRPYVLSLNLETIADPLHIIKQALAKVVVVTNLGDSHLVYQKNKHKRSSAIRDFLKALPKETLIILNKDDDLVSELEDDLMGYQIIKYGFNTRADFFATQIQQKGHHGISFRLNDNFPIFIRIYQYTQLYNVLSAITVARLFNLKIKLIQERLEKDFLVPKGRCNLVSYENFSILNDTFNHSFQTVTSAAQTLVTFKNYSNKMIMVIGDVEAEHDKQKQLHINIGHFLAALPIDVILTFGLYAKYIEEGIRLIPNENRTIIHSNSAAEVLMNVQLFLEANDTILLKGDQQSGISRFLELLDEQFGRKSDAKSE